MLDENYNNSMVRKALSEIVHQMYEDGLKDEYFVMEAVSHTLGGVCTKSTTQEDRIKHVDFWWESPKKGLVGIDVKGIKRNNRKDDKLDDSIHWVEVQSVNGNKGWIYGEASYIAFRTFKNVIFVKNTTLQKLSEDIVKTKELVFRNPKECYVPYQRWGRKDIVFKIPTEDLIKMSDFIIDCEKEAQ